MLIETLECYGKEKNFQRGEFIFRKGELTSNLFLIKKGLAKAYYETLNGKEFIKSFVKEGGVIASLQTIITGNSVSFSVLCLEDCKVLEIPKSVLMDMMADCSNMSKTINLLLLKLAAKKELREYELLCLSPEERYLNFFNREPELADRLSQNNIALYIGITPVALSRIRKRCQSKISALTAI